MINGFSECGNTICYPVQPLSEPGKASYGKLYYQKTEYRVAIGLKIQDILFQSQWLLQSCIISKLKKNKA